MCIIPRFLRLYVHPLNLNELGVLAFVRGCSASFFFYHIFTHAAAIFESGDDFKACGTLNVVRSVVVWSRGRRLADAPSSRRRHGDYTETLWQTPEIVTVLLANAVARTHVHTQSEMRFLLYVHPSCACGRVCVCARTCTHVHARTHTYTHVVNVPILDLSRNPAAVL